MKESTVVKVNDQMMWRSNSGIYTVLQDGLYMAGCRLGDRTLVTGFYASELLASVACSVVRGYLKAFDTLPVGGEIRIQGCGVEFINGSRVVFEGDTIRHYSKSILTATGDDYIYQSSCGSFQLRFCWDKVDVCLYFWSKEAALKARKEARIAVLHGALEDWYEMVSADLKAERERNHEYVQFRKIQNSASPNSRYAKSCSSQCD